MPKKGCCRECKYADWDADGCACMIDGFFVCDASDHTCDHYRPAKPMTNADRIRQMTDEELAEMFARIGERCRKRAHCYNCPLNNGCNYDGISTPFEIWLKQEVSEDAEKE